MRVNYLFRMKMAVLFFLNALLLPLIILNRDMFTSGAFVICFILIQVIILLAFAMAEEATVYEWWTFAITALASIYVFIVLVLGRSPGFEWIGFLLFIAYLASAVIFLVSKGKKVYLREEESGMSEEELREFRQRDELEDLLEPYSVPEAPSQSHLTDYPDFRKQAKQSLATPGTRGSTEPKGKAIFKEGLEKSWEDQGIMEFDENEGYYEIKPTITYTASEEEEEGYLEVYPDGTLEKKKDISVKELKETPGLDVNGLKKGRKELKEKTQTIDEKIRLIAEKAILEGAQKKLERATQRIKASNALREKSTLEKAQKMIDKAVKKAQAKKAPAAAYSSITGNKFHTDRKCLALKRIKKKDIVLYPSAKEAQKQGLKPCGICRK